MTKNTWIFYFCYVYGLRVNKKNCKPQLYDFNKAMVKNIFCFNETSHHDNMYCVERLFVRFLRYPIQRDALIPTLGLI